jgi:hypothetical protein
MEKGKYGKERIVGIGQSKPRKEKRKIKRKEREKGELKEKGRERLKRNGGLL